MSNQTCIRFSELPVEFSVDENFYLNLYPDVAAAITIDASFSASEHFKEYGIHEGRIPNERFGHEFLKWVGMKRGDYAKAQGNTNIENEINLLRGLVGISFFQALDAQMYFLSPQPKEGRQEFINGLVNLFDDLGDREKIFIFQWMLANHQHVEAERLVQSIDRISNGDLLPSLFKYLDAYYLDTGLLKNFRKKIHLKLLASSEYKLFKNTDDNVFTDGLLRAHASEIDARYNDNSQFALPRTQRIEQPKNIKRHIFIGFFGQLRFPHETLPQLCDLFRSTFYNTKLSFGVSTWDKQGVREIDVGHPVNFAVEQLPIEFESFCLSQGIHSFAGFKRVFPSLATFLERRGETSKDVNESLIQKLCGADTQFSIETDASFMSTAGKVITEAFPAQGHMLNQGRMWNRINKLGDMVLNAEIDDSPVTDIILLRSDIKVKGDLEAAIKPFLEADVLDKRVLVDYDAHAINLSGIGDRIFLAKRDSGFRIIDGERIMIKAILDGGLTKDLYYWFMTMHTYPQTLIYQHGCNPTSIDRNLFALEIYRGRLNWDQIADCAALDAANSSISRVKEFLAELLDKTQ